MHYLHGSVRETAAVIMRALTCGILGTQKASREGTADAEKRSPQAVCEQILRFVEDVTR